MMAAPASAQVALPALPAVGVDASVAVDAPIQPLAGTVSGLDPTGTASTVTSLLPDGHVEVQISAGTQGIDACADAVIELCAGADVQETVAQPLSLFERLQQPIQDAASAAHSLAMTVLDALSSIGSAITGLIGF